MSSRPFSMPPREEILQAIEDVLAEATSSLPDEMLTVKVGAKLGILYDRMPRPDDLFHTTVISIAQLEKPGQCLRVRRLVIQIRREWGTPPKRRGKYRKPTMAEFLLESV